MIHRVVRAAPLLPACLQATEQAGVQQRMFRGVGFRNGHWEAQGSWDSKKVYLG